MHRIWPALILSILITGCASTTHQSEALLSAKPPRLPESKKLQVPFINQSTGYCGPATLTMAMRAAGAPITIGEIAPQVFTPGSKGTLQADMIGATRRRGMLAVSLDNLHDVLKEVANGNPVIVFENLGLSWYPVWHYAVVTGYDLRKKEIILHSGADAYKRENLGMFEHAWNLGGYWALVILPAGKLAAGASELAHVTAAAGLEQAGRLKEADATYQAILERWPWSVASLIGLGNVNYRNGDMRGALTHLRRATKLDPTSDIARHNLEVVRRKFR